MNYIVNEYQTNGDTTAVVPAKVETLESEANAKFFEACSYASRSSVELHVVTLETAEGRQLRREQFVHPVTEETGEE